MLGEVSEEQMEVFRQRKLRDRIYHLKMTTYAVITVFLGGFGWYWWSSGGFQVQSSIGPYYLMGLSAVAYLVVRALLFQTKHRQKKLKQHSALQRELREKAAALKDDGG
jgi:hypothetical protein